MGLIEKFISRMQFCPRCGSLSIRRTAKLKMFCKGCRTKYKIIRAKDRIEVIEEGGFFGCGMSIDFLKLSKKHRKRQKFP